MSRHHPSSAHGQAIRRIGHDHYRMSWVVDYHYPTSSLRFPRSFSRDTDRAGAERFVKRHKLEYFQFPAERLT